MSDDLMIPTVNMNGTSKDELVRELREAFDAVCTAIDKHADCTVHGRDFYVQGPDAINAALFQRRARSQKLWDVRNELQNIIIALQRSA